MARVEVDIEPGDDEAEDVHATEEAVYEDPPRSESRRRGWSSAVEVEREHTKRQLIQSVSSIVVVVLYMLFTLLRDRDAGVVVVDPGDAGPEDDWAE